MANKLEFAKRNQKLSQKLYAEKEYYDWSTTISFYSAIHFIEAVLLPCKIGIVECNTIYDLKNFYNARSPHEGRHSFIQDKHNQIFESYDYLEGRAKTARYTTFKIQSAVAIKCIEHLKKIENYCNQYQLPS